MVDSVTAESVRECDREAVMTVYAPPYIGRSDTGRIPVRESIKLDIEHCSGMMRVGEASGGFTVAASPHTPFWAPTELYRDAIRDTLEMNGFRPLPSPALPHELRNQEHDAAPLHLTSFCYRGSTRAQCDFYDIASFSPADRADYFTLLQQNTKAMYDVLQRLVSNPEVRKRNGIRSRDIRQLMSEGTSLFFLEGHGVVPDQERTGLSRGSKSNRDCHVNLVFAPHQYLEYTKRTPPQPGGFSAASGAKGYDSETEEVFPNYLYKQVGPFDTLCFEAINNLVSGSYQRFGTHIVIAEHIDRGDPMHNPNRRPYFEGVDITPAQPIAMPQAMDFITELLLKGETVYSNSLWYFEQYYKRMGNPDSQQQIMNLFYEELARELLVDGASQARHEVQSRGLHELGRLIFGRIKPTYRQLEMWLDSPDIHDSESRRYLESMRQQYEKRFERLQDSVFRQGRVRRLVRHHNLSWNAARALIQMEEDTYRDTYRDYPETTVSKKTMPVHFSASVSLKFVFDADGKLVLDADGNALVRGGTIAPRFSEKGFQEDRSGSALIRQLAF